MKRKIYILGAGLHYQKAKDEVTVDVLPGENIDIQHDLNVTPWPISDGAAMHVNASHLAEHLLDLVSFMNECHRILSPGGTLLVKVPDAENLDMAWADPTHKRPFRVHTFINYFTIEGVHKFGYTDKAWAILYLKSDGSEIVLHATPIPPEFNADSLLTSLGK